MRTVRHDFSSGFRTGIVPLVQVTLKVLAGFALSTGAVLFGVILQKLGLEFLGRILIVAGTVGWIVAAGYGWVGLFAAAGFFRSRP